MSQAQGAYDIRRVRVEVVQKRWKGLDQFGEVSRMSKGMGKAHNVLRDIRSTCGVAGSISMGGNLVGT